MLTWVVSFLSPEHEGAFSDSFIELSSKKKARVRHSSSRREGEHASVSEHSGRSHTFPSHPPPLLPLHTHTLFLMLLFTFSLTSSYAPDEDTTQTTEGYRVVRPARGRGRSARATLATSSSDKCRSGLKPGSGRGRGRSAKAGATSLTIGAYSGKSLINTRICHYPPPPPPPHTHTRTHTLFLMLLLTFSLMSSYTPDEDTAQAIEGHRVVRPARGRGRGCGHSAMAGASFLTIGGVSDDSGKSLINTSTRPYTWFTHSVFLNVWCWHEWCHSYLQSTRVLFLTVSLNFHRRRKPESDIPPAGEKESMLVFQNRVVGHTPSPLPPLPPPSSPYTHTHTPFLVLLLTFSLMSSYTPDEDTGQATEGRRVVRPARGRGRGRSAKTTLATSSSDKCRSDLKPGRGRGGRTSSRVGATSLTIGAVSEHSGRSHTFPSHPPPPPPHQPLTHTLFSSCCYSHSHSCPLILQMKTLLKLQRAIELSDQHMVVVVVVVPRPLLQLVPATSAGQVWNLVVVVFVVPRPEQLLSP